MNFSRLFVAVLLALTCSQVIGQPAPSSLPTPQTPSDLPSSPLNQSPQPPNPAAATNNVNTPNGFNAFSSPSPPSQPQFIFMNPQQFATRFPQAAAQLAQQPAFNLPTSQLRSSPLPFNVQQFNNGQGLPQFGTQQQGVNAFATNTAAEGLGVLGGLQTHNFPQLQPQLGQFQIQQAQTPFQNQPQSLAQQLLQPQQLQQPAQPGYDQLMQTLAAGWNQLQQNNNRIFQGQQLLNAPQIGVQGLNGYGAFPTVFGMGQQPVNALTVTPPLDQTVNMLQQLQTPPSPNTAGVGTFNVPGTPATQAQPPAMPGM